MVFKKRNKFRFKRNNIPYNKGFVHEKTETIGSCNSTTNIYVRSRESIQNETTKEHITADNGRNVKFLRPLEKIGKKTQSNADEPVQW